MSDFNIDTIPMPDLKDLNEYQKDTLDSYKIIYAELQNSPRDPKIIKTATNILTNFYHSLTKELKQQYATWYKYQVNLVDPFMGPSLKFAELLSATGLEDRAALSSDGTKFVVPYDSNSKKDNFATTQLLKLLGTEFPNLHIDISGG